MNLPALTFKAYISLLITVIGMCLLSACHKQEHRNNEITKIEVATGGCFGPCQRTVVSIDDSLLFKFYGGGTSFPMPPGRDSMLEGYYNGRISQKLWKALNAKLKQIHYQQLDTAYKRSVDDQSLEIIIHYQGKVKHIEAQSASLPDSVREVFYWIAAQAISK
jgi:hypothetical protein